MDIERFKKKPYLGILRGIEETMLEPLIETIINAGLETIEITMNTENAAALIRSAVSIAKNKLMIGAGTVCDMQSLHAAHNAGATFIVSPVLVEEVVGYCNKQNLAVFPGALSPQEIFRAWNTGATMVKVFPAKVFGPSYFKEIKGPFNDVKLLACGGVTPENKDEYFSNGADAVAFGASVFKNEWLRNKEFDCIAENIKRYVHKATV